MKTHKSTLLSFVAALLGCVACAPQVTAAPDTKLDEAIDRRGGPQPVFVRLDDQLFPTAGAFEAFCGVHEHDRRSDVRALVLKELRQRADRSWAELRDKVAELQALGSVKDLTRFWIVNGFACEATGPACETLAACPRVAFVYRQRGPERVRQHHAMVEPSRAAERGNEAKTIDQLPPERRSRLLERLTREGIDPAQVKVRTIGPEGATPSAAEERVRMERLLREVTSDQDEPFNARELEIPWNLKLIQADQVWEREKVTGRGAVVAVNDGGVVDIPALRPALWRNPAELPNGKDDDGDGCVDDFFGYDFSRQTNYILDSAKFSHGTVCAGIIAGRPVPGQRLVTGVAPRARLMVLKGMGYLRAYEYALLHGADVLSMSYMWVNMDLGDYRGVFRAAAEHTTAGGVLCVGGAGNFAQSAPPGRQIALPKDIPCVVAVSGVLNGLRRPPFSSKGPCTWSGVRFYDDYPADHPLAKPDLAAPVGGFPCWSYGTPPPNRNWKVVWDGKEAGTLVTGPQGNSFAGPHAAGVAALMFAAAPELNAWVVKRLMEKTCRDLGEPGRDPEYGAGLLQAADAVRAAKKAAAAR
jgi:subtilisin family serine protease